MSACVSVHLYSSVEQNTHRGMRYANVTSLYFATPLVFNAPDGGVPWDDLRKILHTGQRVLKVENSEEILPKASTPGVGHINVTDDRQIYDSKDRSVT